MAGKLEQQYSTIKKWFTNKVLKDKDELFYFLQAVGKEKSERHMREVLGHEDEGFQANIRLQIYDLLRAIVSKRESDKEFKVLWIENNPYRALSTIDERFVKVLKNKNLGLKDALINTFSLIDNSSVYLYKEDFQTLYKDLVATKQKKKKTITIPCELLKKEGDEPCSISIDDLNMVLVDIALEEGDRKAEVDGIDFANALREVCPHIPVFIFSVIGDFETIHTALANGADFYITKNQVFSVPFLYHAYVTDIGELIHFIKNRDLQRSLLGNIRYWKHKRNYLWFGDKCYHMIDHSFNHIVDDWEIANKILIPLLRTGFLETEQRRDDLLYAFSMAIWLHDIGHKGTHRYGEPHLIRETHGIISGEIILSLPGSFRIPIGKSNNHIYKDLLFPVGKERKPVTQLILEQVKLNKTLTIPEMIALFSIYHKSNCPLREKEYYEMVRNGKFIPSDFFENSTPGKPVIPLERILNEIKDNDFKNNFLVLTALFRFIDGLDIKVTRVGDPNEEDMKKWVINRDLEYNFKRMERLVERMANIFSNNALQQASFVKSFFLDMKEKIKKKESISVNELAQQLSQFEEWEEYRMILFYCYFIGAQEGHFDLHSSIESIEIKYLGGRCFEIILLTEKEEQELKNLQVFEVGKGTESLYDRIIGKSCYTLRELNSGAGDLKKVLNKVIIRLKNSITGDIYGEPKIWP